MSLAFEAAGMGATRQPHEMGFVMAGLEICKHFYAPLHNAAVNALHEHVKPSEDSYNRHSYNRHNEWLLWRKASNVLEHARIKHDADDLKYKRALSYFATRPVFGVVRKMGLRHDIETLGQQHLVPG
jgi:hypothetical protein